MTPSQQLLLLKIKKLSYEEMLHLSRHMTGDHMYFQGEVGQFFVQRMAYEGSLLTKEEKEIISQRVGW